MTFFPSQFEVGRPWLTFTAAYLAIELRHCFLHLTSPSDNSRPSRCYASEAQSGFTWLIIFWIKMILDSYSFFPTSSLHSLLSSPHLASSNLCPFHQRHNLAMHDRSHDKTSIGLQSPAPHHGSRLEKALQACSEWVALQVRVCSGSRFRKSQVTDTR